MWFFFLLEISAVEVVSVLDSLVGTEWQQAWHPVCCLWRLSVVVCVLEILATEVEGVSVLGLVVVGGGSVDGCLIAASLTETTLEVLLMWLLSLTALRAM